MDNCKSAGREPLVKVHLLKYPAVRFGIAEILGDVTAWLGLSEITGKRFRPLSVGIFGFQEKESLRCEVLR